MDDLWLTLQRNIFQLDTILNLYNVAIILVGVVVLLVVTYLWLWWVCDIHHRFSKQGIDHKIKISKIKSRDKAKREVQKLSEVYVLAELDKKLHPIEKEAKLLNSDIKRKAKAKLKSRLKQLARVKKQGRIEQEAKELLKIKAELRTRIRTRQIDKDIQKENGKLGNGVKPKYQKKTWQQIRAEQENKKMESMNLSQMVSQEACRSTELNREQ